MHVMTAEVRPVSMRACRRQDAACPCHRQTAPWSLLHDCLQVTAAAQGSSIAAAVAADATVTAVPSSLRACKVLPASVAEMLDHLCCIAAVATWLDCL